MRFVCLLLLACTPVVAQESTSARLFVCYEHAGCPSVDSVRAQEAAASKPKPFYKDWQFWVPRGISVGMSLLDAETTVRCRDILGRPCLEGNPLLGAGKAPSRKKLYLIGGVSEAVETTTVVLVWKKNRTYGRVLNWFAAGTRAVLHGDAISQNREEGGLNK